MTMQLKIYYYWLDWLRWLSALIVVLDHSRCWVFQSYGSLTPDAQGLFAKVFFTCALLSHEAVMLFFILSGFLVGGKTIEALLKGDDISVKSFFVNRMTRIWVPLAYALTLWAGCQLVMEQSPNAVNLIGNFLCLNEASEGVRSELAILWTMPYIVWFYMLLASVIMIFGKSNNKQISAGVVLLCITLVVATALTMKLFIVVTLGVLAYFLSKKRLPKLFTLFVMLMAVGLAFFTKLVRPSNAFDQSGWIQYFNLDTLKLIEGVVFAVLVSQIVHLVPRGRTLKVEQSAKHLAKFSYSMYLTHLIVINMLVWVGMPQYDSFTFESIVVYLGLVGLCILFGYISYLLVERHTGKVKKLLQ